MNKFFIVLMHTYSKHIKSKAFFISTLITVFLIFALSTTNEVVKENHENAQKTIALINENSEINSSLVRELNKEKIKVKKFQNENEVIELVKQNELQALLIIDINNDRFKATYKANQLVDFQLMLSVEMATQKAKEEWQAKKYQLTTKEFEDVKRKIIFEKVPLLEKAKSEKEVKQSTLIVFGLLIIIYATVVFYGSAIAVEVASEKSSRVMEILISSVEPVKQMFGKIFGVALVGLTQYLIFFLVGFFRFQDSRVDLTSVPTKTYMFAIVFFLLGYFFYASLLAMIGSIINRIEDVHQTIAPVNVLVITGFVLSLISIVDPSTSLTTFSSFVPFWTPMIMFLRIALLDVPTWQIVLSMVEMVISIIIISLIGAKVYKGGVFYYGKTSYKNLFKALKDKK